MSSYPPSLAAAQVAEGSKTALCPQRPFYRQNDPMKHAGAQALGRLTGLLESIRKHQELTEKSRGAFYLRARAALHFHEDPRRALR